MASKSISVNLAWRDGDSHQRFSAESGLRVKATTCGQRMTDLIAKGLTSANSPKDAAEGTIFW